MDDSISIQLPTKLSEERYFLPLVFTLRLTNGEDWSLWQFIIKHVIRLKGSFGKKSVALDKLDRDIAYNEIVRAINALYHTD